MMPPIATRAPRQLSAPPPRRLHPAQCRCRACAALRHGPADRAPCAPLSWRARLVCLVAGIIVAQLALVLIDPLIGGPGPFAWLGVFK